jgi:outer membrane protein assembly factor BamB
MGNLPDPYEIAADSEKIYLAVQYQWRAYDIMTGSEVWRSNEMPTTKIRRTELVDQNLKVFTDEDSFNKSEYVTYVVNTTTGSIKEETRKNLDNNVRWLCEDSSAVYWADPVRIWAVDKLTDQNLWEADIKTAKSCTNISSNSMVIQSDFGFSEIYGIDRATGKTTWSYPKTVISNITNDEDTIYAIIENGNLVGIDSVTGQEIGATEFSHPRELQGSISEAYFVVGTNGMLYAYLGDSQEIIAFDLVGSK